MHANIKNIIGRRFTRLTVIKYLGNMIDHRSTWLCKCDCGKTKITTSCRLMGGQVKSCGCLKTQRILPPGQSALNNLYRGYKQGAKSKHLDFELSIDEFAAITKQNCYYCGSAPSKKVSDAWKKNGHKLNGDYIYNGIDRKDNKVGYVKDNIVPCCWQCNYLKRSIHHDTFLDTVEKIALFRLCMYTNNRHTGYK